MTRTAGAASGAAFGVDSTQSLAMGRDSPETADVDVDDVEKQLWAETTR
jgi:hypothetical protein